MESLGQAGAIAAAKLQTVQQALVGITTPSGLEDTKKQIEDIGKQFDANKTRESALNYVHNLEFNELIFNLWHNKQSLRIH